MKKTDDRVKRTVRLPPKLSAQLEECAKANGHSVNAEIVGRLRRSIEGYVK